MAKESIGMSFEGFEAVADLFGVLADSSRLMILYLLKKGPAFVSQVVQKTGLKQSNASKHLAVLYDAGLLGRERMGNQIRYFVADELVFELCTLVCGKLHRDAAAHAHVLKKVAG